MRNAVKESVKEASKKKAGSKTGYSMNKAEWEGGKVVKRGTLRYQASSTISV